MTERLQQFVCRVDEVLAHSRCEEQLLPQVRTAMRELVAADDWLAPAMAQPHAVHYQQYLLHLDPQGRFSVVSFVWGPGQKTPVHDHTVWGVIGMLRGAERAVGYRRVGNALVADGAAVRLAAGDVEIVSPSIGDIHQVSNAVEGEVSISIHCYGADIGRVRRHVFDPATGAVKEFVSGYASTSEDAA
ncbi:cysteine dioxygenase [Comamonadaceae bacterium G21597-S1]|nr:cysteine dioxygenase [Comamonadaceae bacterium G21597-S1]